MKKENLILGLIFLILLLLPLFGQLTKLSDQFLLFENRNLASYPKLALYMDYPKDFEKYFADNFGFRGLLVSLDNNLRLNFFKRIQNDSVTLGKDNWLFYTSDQNYLDVINADLFSESDLKGIKEKLEEADKFFNSQGIKFIVMVSPNKSTIYPQYLPEYMKKASPKSRLEQIDEYFKNQNASFSFVNPTEQLKAESQKTQVFYKYDTHWNQYGGYVTYKELMKKVQEKYPNLKEKELSEFNLIFSESSNKDLQTLLGVGDRFKENEPIFTPINKEVVSLTQECPKPFLQCAEQIKQVNNPNLPKLVMFRDSFGVALIPFLSEHFQRSYYIWKVMPFSLDIIEKEKPDLVIFQIVERDLWRLKDPIFTYP